MTKIHRGIGLACQYPENWNLTEDTDENGIIGFTLESPSSAFLTVCAYPWTVAPRQAIEQVHEALKAEYDDVECEEIDPAVKIGDKTIADARGAEFRFYCLDLLVVSRLIAFSIEHRTYLIQFQAEDRDFQTLEMVFQALVVGMLRSLDQSPQE